MKDRILKLREVLNEYSYNYHVLDNPTIDDYTYDELFNELVKLENEYPEYDDETSITKRVGGEVLDSLQKVKHDTPMLSLDNVFNYQELENWATKIENTYGKISYTVELKIDGLAMSLVYKDGVLNRGVTRGDKEYGEDVTNNIKTIKAIPLKLTSELNIEVRGEVFMPKKSFAKINKIREANNEQLFANPRNAASGSIRQLDPKVVSKRELSMFVYYLANHKELNINNHYDSLKWLENQGFKTNKEAKLCSNIKEVYEYISHVEANRDNYSYEIDGMVIKVNDFNTQEALGTTIRAPRHSIAYKFKAQEKETKIEDIFVTIGRTGKVTPNAKLTPIDLAGSKITYVSLHNEDYIKNKDLRINDQVLVRKAGDIIPEIVKSLVEKRDSNSKIYIFPEKCPICNHELHRYKDEANHYCINSNCDAKIIETMVYFASRDCMNIDSLGEKNVELLYKNNLLKSIVDIYKLENKKEEIIKLDGFGLKSYEKLINGINESKKLSLERLICALGIRQIGEKASKTLARNYLTLENIINKEVNEIESIKDFGSVSAKSLVDYFKDDNNLNMINELIELNLNTSYLQETSINSIFTNKVVVLTGTLENIDRKKAISILEKHQAKVTNSVSKNTDYLICGTSAGSKLEKAIKLEINIIYENEFIDIIGNEVN